MKNWPISFHIATLAVLSGLLVFLLAAIPSKSDANLPVEPESLPLPKLDLSKSAAIGAAQADEMKTPQNNWIQKTVTIKRNDALSTALERVGVGASTVYKISQTKNSGLMTNLKVGDKLTVWLDQNSDLQRIVYPKSKTLDHELIRTDTGFRINKVEKSVEIRTKTAYGEIKGAFYPAAERAGLSPKSIMQLAEMLAWDVDLSRELRDGDYFKVIYETRYLNDEYIGDGDILAVQITSDGGKQIHNGFILRDGDEVIGYYDENGNNLKKAFLKAPLDTVRITSRFNPKRLHPIFGKRRPHRGVDYGAPTGTPIKVTGNGQIVYRGWKGGYGKVVKVRHNNTYTTMYAHMSRFGKYKKGQMVKQGQVIGYVGSTGNSTGAHLHYEFLLNGKHVDPLKIKFPAAGPVNAKYKQDFLRRSHFLLGQLDRLDQSTQLAFNFE
ncbi:peptidoglycan DD-metalloendopeptidase family protein [Thiomicrorhabdus sp. 6S3-12]|uniref:peptidoglycan DD-metalloendopeptidase family protein n=1 Tax=Thiomicrorhabdus sp. 6S3-12 TaxID=2819681 RepID=UPI001AADA792|nr:peptidoglycan DD-metalloendopeptidase family protein [Thiomicrorhabdus sp. 6S3-12]MBO1923177.1 peptidoglycan DD-metalloendopeptidase family protein [Thiomicrorhabdus sp. 6S3-12]